MPGSKLSFLYKELIQQLEMGALITSLESPDSLVLHKSATDPRKPKRAEPAGEFISVHWKWEVSVELPVQNGTKQVSVSTSGSGESEHQLFHPALNDTLFQHVFPSVKNEDKWSHAAMLIDKDPATLVHG